jgi:hypothetical protein
MPRPMFFHPNGGHCECTGLECLCDRALSYFATGRGKCSRVSCKKSFDSEEAWDLLLFVTGCGFSSGGTSFPTTTAATEIVYKFDLHLYYLAIYSHSDHTNNDIHQGPTRSYDVHKRYRNQVRVRSHGHQAEPVPRRRQIHRPNNTRALRSASWGQYTNMKYCYISSLIT